MDDGHIYFILDLSATHCQGYTNIKSPNEPGKPGRPWQSPHTDIRHAHPQRSQDQTAQPAGAACAAENPSV
jgi:hypothetical protein